MGEIVDGMKFSGGFNNLMSRSYIEKVTEMAHKHNVYVSSGDWGEHLVRKDPSAFQQYIEECKRLGFDTIEPNVRSLELPEESLLRFVRLIKSAGMRAKPQFALKCNKSDIPGGRNRAYAAYVVPSLRSEGGLTLKDLDMDKQWKSLREIMRLMIPSQAHIPDTPTHPTPRYHTAKKMNSPTQLHVVEGGNHSGQEEAEQGAIQANYMLTPGVSSSPTQLHFKVSCLAFKLYSMEFCSQLMTAPLCI
ncbi:hypothetical protein Drorol1_Dr00022140 [Drosera rotundifolia]